MRDIRGRIAQRQGIDLSNQQIQDLAARRLESILDPRAIKPSLLDGLRRGAAAPMGPADKVPNEPAFSFEDTTIYDSHRGALRFARRLMNPLLKLFFNPNPLIRALHLQAKLNVEASERNAERDRRQTEWNALHYEIIQRLVTDVARASLELQALSMRVEALVARVDFNDRRVGALEGATARTRPQGRPVEPFVSSPSVANPVVVVPVAQASSTPVDAATTSSDAHSPDAARRRRRRRRGRRSGSGPGEYAPTAETGGGAEVSPADQPTVAIDGPSAGDESRGSSEDLTPAGMTDGPVPRELRDPTPAQPSTPPEAKAVSLLPPDADRRED